MIRVAVCIGLLSDRHVQLIQNVIGMSVVGSDYEELKRFNLMEIYSPTPKPQQNLAS